MNEIKITTGATKNEKALSINGKYFPVNSIRDMETFEQKITGYSVTISPDYNQSANFVVKAKSVKALAEKLQAVDYTIVKSTLRH